MGLRVWWFIWFLGRMVDNGHDNNLKVVQLQGLPTFVANYEHFGDFGVKSVDGTSGGNLPNDTN